MCKGWPARRIVFFLGQGWGRGLRLRGCWWVRLLLRPLLDGHLVSVIGRIAAQIIERWDIVEASVLGGLFGEVGQRDRA